MSDPRPFETTGPLNEKGLLPFDAGKDSCGVGFVADLKNRRSHKIVDQGLVILERLAHRGACGCEENTGDGAGVLTQLPHQFLAKAAKAAGVEALPAEGAYGVAFLFLPKDPAQAAQIQSLFERIVREEGQRFLGWRGVPVVNSMIGPTALKGEPAMAQAFIAANPALPDQDAFERKLYLIRKRSEGEVPSLELAEKQLYYVASCSS
ncbi:MAG TPA: glutamate synthase subunit alpha, partial [bacterium]|nr:glutamate synthase subunit alpha [bacterium]